MVDYPGHPKFRNVAEINYYGNWTGPIKWFWKYRWSDGLSIYVKRWEIKFFNGR